MMKIWLLAYCFIFFVINIMMDIGSSLFMNKSLTYDWVISQEFENYIYYREKNSKNLDFMFDLDKEQYKYFITNNPKSIEQESLMELVGQDGMKDKSCPRIVNLLMKEDVSFSDLPKEIIENIDYKKVFVCQSRMNNYKNFIEYLLDKEDYLINKNIAYAFSNYFSKGDSNICEFFKRSQYQRKEPLFLYQKEFYKMYSDIVPRLEKCDFFKKANLEVIKNIYPKLKQKKIKKTGEV